MYTHMLRSGCGHLEWNLSPLSFLTHNNIILMCTDTHAITYAFVWVKGNSRFGINYFHCTLEGFLRLNYACDNGERGLVNGCGQ